MSDGHIIPKWQKFLGFSKMDAVGLILNPQSSFVTPHFHVMFDEIFSTVVNPAGNYLEDSVWPQFWQFQTCQYVSDDNPAPWLHSNWKTQNEQLNSQSEDINDFIRPFGRSTGR